MRRFVSLAAAGLALFALTIPVAQGAAKGSCAPAKHAGGDWPMFGHDYGNTRFQDKEFTIGTLQAPTLQEAWAFSTDGKGDFTGNPIVANGCVFVGSNGGWTFALNADTGALAWQAQVDKNGGINSSAAVDDGRVFFTVSNPGKPSVVALDAATGKLLWRTVETSQPGSDVYASPVVWNGMVLTGWSGGSAELGDDGDRRALQGGFVILDAATGKLLKRTYTIHPPSKKQKDNFAGGGIWSTAAIDTKNQTAFVGTGNPFRAEAQHKYTDSILKIDLNRSHATFGQIIDHFQGVPETYDEAFDQLPCYDIPGNPPPWGYQGGGFPGMS